MKKIMLLLVIIILFLQGCGYKTKEEVVKYFSTHYEDFEKVREYLEGSDLYFTCRNKCNIQDQGEYIYLIGDGKSYGSIYSGFNTMSSWDKEFFSGLNTLFTGKMRGLMYDLNELSFSLENSLFFIVYLSPQQVKIYDKCSDEEGYFGNITGNWYYSFHEYDICERNKD